MKKIIIAIALSLTNLLSGHAQDSIGTVFASIPSHIIFGLDPSQIDMLLAEKSDTTEVRVAGKLYEHMKRLGISPDFISLQTSDAGTTQIKLLPLINDSKIICVVKTVCGNFCDSHIQFYTTKWAPISQSDLFPKIDKDWFIKPDADRENQDFKNAYAALDMNPVKITLSPLDSNISVAYDIKNYLSKDDYNAIKPFLIEEPKVLKWDKNSFK